MRSSPSARRPPLSAAVATRLAAAVAAALAALSPGCGSDTDPYCDQSFLRYDNFGSPFIANWCRACHSVEIPPDMRQEAPTNVNFDTLGEIRAWSTRIELTARDGGSMPPAGGPSASERTMLLEWMRCGAPP